MHSVVWSQYKWVENCGGGSAPFLEGGLGPHLIQSAWAEAYHHAKCHLDPSSRLATINMGLKFVGLLGSGLGPRLTQSPLTEAYLRTKWHLDASSRLATIEMGRKLGMGLCPLFREGRLGPHLTQSRLR